MFNIHQSIFDKYGELDERRFNRYIDDLMEAFAASPETQPIIQEQGGVSWAGMMLDYAFGHLGVALPEMSPRDFNEIVFELFPRKVSTEPESAPEIIAELRAFWQFLQREYHLTNAEPILKSLTDKATVKLRNGLANPANYGMAKSFFMQGMKSGHDMSTQEGLDAFMLDYNARLLGGGLGGLGGKLGGLGGELPLPPLLPFEDEDFEDEDFEDVDGGPPPLTPEQRRSQHEKKRKARKAQRQARKKHRK